ncbi:MAG TPA: hypothetical protein G4O18_05265 [Dehalococcoidia bacterium]|nr:hypothetical protein [Dehalococcoidia bacterium]
MAANNDRATPVQKGIFSIYLLYPVSKSGTTKVVLALLTFLCYNGISKNADFYRVPNRGTGQRQEMCRSF